AFPGDDVADAPARARGDVDGHGLDAAVAEGDARRRPVLAQPLAELPGDGGGHNRGRRPEPAVAKRILQRRCHAASPFHRPARPRRHAPGLPELPWKSTGAWPRRQWARPSRAGAYWRSGGSVRRRPAPEALAFLLEVAV